MARAATTTTPAGSAEKNAEEPVARESGPAGTRCSCRCSVEPGAGAGPGAGPFWRSSCFTGGGGGGGWERGHSGRALCVAASKRRDQGDAVADRVRDAPGGRSWTGGSGGGGGSMRRLPRGRACGRSGAGRCGGGRAAAGSSGPPGPIRDRRRKRPAATARLHPPSCCSPCRAGLVVVATVACDAVAPAIRSRLTARWQMTSLAAAATPTSCG